ncbi:hypothetical protein ABT369_18645, partial [Dactylosporangium sp. NPDC000244]|uniref:hypothetical protein n=1 Tax=Dactylosporangium sp. NPDC000244 TaxID=3154365 RepID=UPI003330BD75
LGAGGRPESASVDELVLLWPPRLGAGGRPESASVDELVLLWPPRLGAGGRPESGNVDELVPPRPPRLRPVAEDQRSAGERERRRTRCRRHRSWAPANQPPTARQPIGRMRHDHR